MPYNQGSPAVQVVEGELIAQQMRALADMENSGMVPMMDQDKYEDLSRMYTLFKRVEGGLDLMRQVRGGQGRAAQRSRVRAWRQPLVGTQRQELPPQR